MIHIFAFSSYAQTEHKIFKFIFEKPVKVLKILFILREHTWEVLELVVAISPEIY